MFVKLLFAAVFFIAVIGGTALASHEPYPQPPIHNHPEHGSSHVEEPAEEPEEPKEPKGHHGEEEEEEHHG